MLIYRERHNLADLEIRNQGTYCGTSRNPIGIIPFFLENTIEI